MRHGWPILDDPERPHAEHVHPEHAHTRDPGHLRGQVTHVIMVDGTLCSLQEPGLTHIGRLYHLLRPMAGAARLSLYYEQGIQMNRWRELTDVALGRGINRQIRRAYGFLASRFREGDRIFLVGFSRGAFAVRSLAGMIDAVGLLRADLATVRNIRTAYRLYQFHAPPEQRAAFAAAHSLPGVTIAMVGVFDTVKALGVRLPVLRRWSEPAHEFHDHRLGPAIEHGYHALALDENRVSYTPILWDTQGESGSGLPWSPRIEQVWFRGAHADIGGKMEGETAALPLSHIPLVWMLERAEACGLPLPEGWRARFPCDAGAPMRGNRRGWGRMFLYRRKRLVGLDPSESIHPTALP